MVIRPLPPCERPAAGDPEARTPHYRGEPHAYRGHDSHLPSGRRGHEQAAAPAAPITIGEVHANPGGSAPLPRCRAADAGAMSPPITPTDTPTRNGGSVAGDLAAATSPARGRTRLPMRVIRPPPQPRHRRSSEASCPSCWHDARPEGAARDHAERRVSCSTMGDLSRHKAQMRTTQQELRALLNTWNPIGADGLPDDESHEESAWTASR